MPKKILNDITAADMGAEHGIAPDAEGRVYAWGWNAYGQSGDGSTDSSADPAEVDLNDILSWW